MTRYFFDVVEDGVFHPDSEGTELRDAEAARVEATQAMAELAHSAIPGSTSKHLHMTVRRRSGGELFSLDLLFSLTAATVTGVRRRQ